MLRTSVFAGAVVDGSIVRVACRAFVIAMFFGLYEQAKQHIAAGQLRRSDLVTCPDDLIVLAGCVTEDVQYGVVALPSEIFSDVGFRSTSTDAVETAVARINDHLSAMR